MDTLEEIVPEAALDEAFGNSNFGDSTHREVVKYTLLKYASGYATGFTARCIVLELNLINTEWGLTEKGKGYLYEAFKEGNHSY